MFLDEWFRYVQARVERRKSLIHHAHFVIHFGQPEVGDSETGPYPGIFNPFLSQGPVDRAPPPEVLSARVADPARPTTCSGLPW